MSRSWLTVNGPQNGWSSGKTSDDASMASARIASTRSDSEALPAPALVRVVAGQSRRRARPSRSDRRAGAGRRAACRRSRARPPGARRRRRRATRRDGTSGLARSTPPASPSSQSARAWRAARHAASADSAEIRAASASIVSRSSSAPIARGGLTLALRGGGRLAGLGVDPVDLGQPGPRGRLDGVLVARPPSGSSGTRAGRRPWLAGPPAGRRPAAAVARDSWSS